MGNLQNSYVKLDKVSKIYKMGEVEIRAVDNISFEISKGEFVVVVGPSGAGKTTVLNILGGMDTASSGRVIVDGKDIAQYSPRQLTAYRRDDIGFVFQFYNLIPNLTALENVELFVNKILTLIEDDTEKLRELFNHSKKGVQYKTDQNFYFLWALLFKISLEELQKRRKEEFERISKIFSLVSGLSQFRSGCSLAKKWR